MKLTQEHIDKISRDEFYKKYGMTKAYYKWSSETFNWSVE